MSSANPLWGAPRIHGELLKLGIEISQATVAKYMVRRRGTPSQKLADCAAAATPPSEDPCVGAFFDLDPGPIALTFGLQPASPERIDSIEIPRSR